MDVKCSEGEQEIDGLCRPREVCTNQNGFWEETVAGVTKCRKKPRMAIKAANDALAVALKKSYASPDARSNVEIRLVSGDVDAASTVEWTASSSSKWLVLGQTSGTVASDHPVAVMSVTALGSGQNDTSASGPLRSIITVSSRIRQQPGRSDLFELNTGSLAMAVEVTIEAALRLTNADVRVVDRDGNSVTDGGEVVSGRTLSVTARAFDFERLQICRTALQIAVQLSQLSGASNESLPMVHHDGNTYQAELPSSWISEPGPYTLWIDGGAVAIRFVAAESSKNLVYLAAALSAVGAVLLIVFAVLVYRGQGSWKKRAEKVAMPVFSVGTIALEVWDVYGDYFSYRTFVEHLNLAATAWMEQLMLPYTIFFGLSCVVAVISIGLKLKIFVTFVARTVGRAASSRPDHEQERADLKKKMAALVLVAISEDLPMGGCPIGRPGFAVAL
jgi:uncharacterized protein with PQ loop repeat